MLTAGTRLGPYEIESPIGAGGMGQVYCARDTRLGRAVAIKVLADGLASDAASRVRFEREARSIATLSHPNICAIYDVGEAADPASPAVTFQYLVLELLSGQNLAERLARGSLPITDVLRIGGDIASALDAAHRAGIVHRDLKPSNIILGRSQGHEPTTKVLDFGLARLAADPARPRPDDTFDATTFAVDPPLTAIGSLVGTVPYMAPEQVEGRAADARSDIFALGAVLFEMTTGRRAFDGKSSAAVAGAILREDPPPIGRSQPLAPTGLERLVQACLAKDPDARPQSAHDVRLQLGWLAEVATPEVIAGAGTRAQQGRNRIGWAAASIGLAAIAAFASWRLRPVSNTSESPLLTLSYSLPARQQIARNNRPAIAISADGSKIAYVADQRLYVQRMDRLEQATPISGTDIDPVQPVFSPNGEWVAYFTSAEGMWALRKVPVSGGSPVRICEISGAAPRGMSWHGNTIVFAFGTSGQASTVETVGDDGSARRVVLLNEAAKANTLGQFQNPQLLAGGRYVMFDARPVGAVAGWASRNVYVQEIGHDTPKLVLRGAGDARLTPSGHLVHATQAAVNAVEFDVSALETKGQPVVVVNGVWTSSADAFGQFAISHAGPMVAIAGGEDSGSSRSLVWVDRRGGVSPLPGPPDRTALQVPRLSPDGSQLAFSARTEMYVWHFLTERLTRLTFDNDVQFNALWLPPAYSSIAFDQGGNSSPVIASKPVNGTGAGEVFLTVFGYPETISSDGRTFIYHNAANVSMVASPGTNTPPRPLWDSTSQLYNAELSPDGRWVAYQSNESGRFEIYVHPFPNLRDGRWQVTFAGGAYPRWAGNGRELFLIAGDGTMTVLPVQTTPSFTTGKAAPLFPTGDFFLGIARTYDVSPSGERFVMIRVNRDTEAGSNNEVVVISNWLGQLRVRSGG